LDNDNEDDDDDVARRGSSGVSRVDGQCVGHDRHRRRGGGLIDLASRNTAKCLAKTSPSANFEAYACKQHNAVIEVQPTVSDGEEYDDGQ
jgi:hypothetical protein